MMDAGTLHTVAVIHDDEDIVETLRLLLEEEGYHAVGELLWNFKEGRADFAAFCQQHQPEVIILDIPPPYQENWSFSDHPSSCSLGLVVPHVHRERPGEPRERLCTASLRPGKMGGGAGLQASTHRDFAGSHQGYSGPYHPIIAPRDRELGSLHCEKIFRQH